MKFTDRYLQSIKPPEKEYCVREGHGFALRVLPSGCMTFQYIFTLDGKRYRLNIGNYPATSLAEAREKYHKAYILVSRGQNPAQKLSSPGTDAPLSVGVLIDRYKEFAAQHFASSTVRETKRTLDKYVLPAWIDRSAISIRRSDAISLIEPLAAYSPGQARGVMKIARAMFNYALDRELVDLNPFTRLPSAIPAVKSCSGKRVLSDSEIRVLWETLTYMHAPGTPESRRALMLILVTGQRPGEIAGMQWSEIEGDWWTIPFDRIKTRNHRQENHRVFLSPLAKRLIGQNPGYSKYVFIGSRPGVPIAEKALSHLVNKKTEGGRTMRDGSVTTARHPYFGLPRWTPHDLRRTAATRLSELGCTDEAIDAILNHAKSGVISVYNLNKYDKEKKEWLTTWGNHLSTLLNPPALVAPV